jgi:hypothetical protein
MQPRLAIEDLSRRSAGCRERCRRQRVGVREVCAEGPKLSVVAEPRDVARRVQLIRVNVVDRDRGSIRAQGGYGNFAEVDRFFDQRAGNGGVFAEEVTAFVVNVQYNADGPAANLDPLAEGVVER